MIPKDIDNLAVLACRTSPHVFNERFEVWGMLLEDPNTTARGWDRCDRNEMFVRGVL